MVSAQDVISIYHNLSNNDIQVWLTGGWGIDYVTSSGSSIPMRILAPDNKEYLDENDLQES